jgi:aminopeptidase N
MKLLSFSPGEWKVITNRFETDTTNSADVYTKFLQRVGCPSDITERFTEDDNMVFRQFETTDRISTYLYAFVVGPYASVSNRAPNAANYVPMRVLARKSIMKYIQVDDFFRVTMAGMDYYEDFFGRKYPFKKYDQIFVPEFNSGAMENVGCVTYTESYLCRGKVIPQSDKEQLANTALHELAHMWFGNLVTMKWWDDLWLNESFATFMAFMAQHNAKTLDDYTLSWEMFIAEKTWGMKTDQYSTTHPIVADCKTTEDADNIFDGISYGKGASFLKQMVAYISEEAFRKGLKSYFQKYAYKNTELVDFINELQDACDSLSLNIDLRKWSDSWLKTSGFNVIESEMELSEGDKQVITSFKLRQSLSEHGDNCLREQKFQIAFFNEKFEVYDVIEVKIEATEETELTELEGKKAPTAYLLNYNDWGYGKFLIDNRSLEAFKEGLCKIQDSLTRKLIHNTVFIMARDAKLSASVYSDIIRNQIIHESNQDIVQEQVWLNTNLILKHYVADEHIEEECDKMLKFLLNDFLPIAPNEELKDILLTSIIALACTEEHFAMLKHWIETDKVTLVKEGITVEVSGFIAGVLWKLIRLEMHILFLTFQTCL